MEGLQHRDRRDAIFYNDFSHTMCLTGGTTNEHKREGTSFVALAAMLRALIYCSFNILCYALAIRQRQLLFK